MSDPGFYLAALAISLALAWSAHFNVEVLGHGAAFFCRYLLSVVHLTSGRPVAVCFLAMVFLQKMFDWGGERLGAHIVQSGKPKSDQRKDLKDLLVITMSKYVAADLPRCSSLSLSDSIYQRDRSHPCYHSTVQVPVRIRVRNPRVMADFISVDCGFSSPRLSVRRHSLLDPFSFLNLQN